VAARDTRRGSAPAGIHEIGVARAGARGGWKPSSTRTNTPSIARAGAWSQKAVEAFGRIDILMNNAGVNKQLNFFEVTERDWDWIHSINTKGLFFCMQAVAREMAKNNYGKIINLASIGGKGVRGTSNVAYAGSKGPRQNH